MTRSGDNRPMTVDEYLAAAPEPQRTTLTQLREILRELLPDATETLSYGVPAFQLEGKTIAGYASFKGHCSYFPHSGSVLSAIADELDGYDWEKGTLRFPVDAPLPKPLVASLVGERLRQVRRPSRRRTRRLVRQLAPLGLVHLVLDAVATLAHGYHHSHLPEAIGHLLSEPY
jgi:uncharacterized protein YdhG (YjbR/CyaY superfamily)